MWKYCAAWGFLLTLFSYHEASAHAFLVTADPPVGGIVPPSISSVTITFTEDLEPRFSSLTVQDADGARIDRDDAHTDPSDAQRFVVDLKALKPGNYKVIWHATSVDTHKTNGSYTFTVSQ